jgi:hypothetical protein
MNELVCLDEHHQELAYHIAAARDIAARISGRAPAYGAAEQGTAGALSTNIEGAAAEVAFWLFTNYEATINAVMLMRNLHEIEADAIWRGQKIEIRATAHRDGHLILRRRDKPDSFYALCIIQHPEYRFPGYLRGRDGQIGAYTHPGREGQESGFWIPQDHLSHWK